MAEYIEREAALEAVKKEREYAGKFSFEEERAWTVGFQQGVSFALSDIAAVPAADVQPVRHGRWIKDSDGLTICSECEEVALQRVFIKLPEKIVDLQMQKSHYCPNCGCRMDMEEVDEIPTETWLSWLKSPVEEVQDG